MAQDNTLTWPDGRPKLSGGGNKTPWAKPDPAQTKQEYRVETGGTQPSGRPGKEYQQTTTVAGTLP